MVTKTIQYNKKNNSKNEILNLLITNCNINSGELNKLIVKITSFEKKACNEKKFSDFHIIGKW